MSNPWASTYDELRAPYLLEKKAKKDYDGDGKVETGSKEHAGVVHNESFLHRLSISVPY